MNGNLDGQVSMFDLVSKYGKTSPEPCQAPEKTKKDETSKPSLLRSSGSPSRMPLMCLCLLGGRGPRQDASTMSWEDGPLPIGSTMLSSTAFLREENGFAYFSTQTDSQHPKFCLTLNLGEKPRIPNPTKLSDILEPEVDPKYNLSARACQGILNRAAKRGKELPKALLDALTEQAKKGGDGTEIPENSSLALSDTEEPKELLPAEPCLSRNEPGATGGQGNPLAE